MNNLLSQGIINADGTPGPNFAKAQQFQITGQNQSYFIAADSTLKTPYTALPQPDTNGAPKAQSTTDSPFTTVAQAAALEPNLEPDDEVLLTTGFTGLPNGPDARIFGRPQYAAGIPSGPYQITGPNGSSVSLKAGPSAEGTKRATRR